MNPSKSKCLKLPETVMSHLQENQGSLICLIISMITDRIGRHKVNDVTS